MTPDHFANIMERLGEIKGDLGRVEGKLETGLANTNSRVADVDMRLGVVEKRQESGYARFEPLVIEIKGHERRLGRLEERDRGEDAVKQAREKRLGRAIVVVPTLFTLAGGIFTWLVSNWNIVRGWLQ